MPPVVKYRRMSEAKRAGITDMLVAGVPYKKIAEEYHVHLTTVAKYYLKNKESINAARIERAEEARNILQGMAIKATDRISELMEDDSARVSLDAAKFVLSQMQKTSEDDALAFLRSLVIEDK